HQLDFDWQGFEWIDCNDSEQSIISLIRKGKSADEVVLAVANFTPVPRYDYRIGVPTGGFWKELLNSDAADYGGSGMGNCGGMEADAIVHHGQPYSLNLTLPPLAIAFFKVC
ncbi:alpha amylase C-terminal domain-containing protein, partial [Allocoleopsis sp.]|uniref:alpha amylase C-terminal domain-containing protein n=1 Tax=Allocoleopsis sp. TaxID=3088169 RepID=UPI002FCFBBDE